MMETYTLCNEHGQALIVIQCEPEKKHDAVKAFEAFYRMVLVVKPGNHFPEKYN